MLQGIQAKGVEWYWVSRCETHKVSVKVKIKVFFLFYVYVFFLHVC